MIKFDYSTIKSNGDEYNLTNRYKPNINMPRINKGKIKKILWIFLFIFVVFNVYAYTVEYKNYVSNAPQKLKEARKEFLKAYMFHLYYGYVVKFTPFDFQNPVLKVFKVPRDYFYHRALEKLPPNEGEKALWFELFEVKPYNFSVRGVYGSMARHYGGAYGREFIDKLYANIEILSTQKVDESYTKNVGRDIIEAYLGMVSVFISEAHLNPKGFIFGDTNMRTYSSHYGLHNRFINIYHWREEFLAYYKEKYPKEYQSVLSENRGWYSPYGHYHDGIITLSSFILFYKIKNNKFDCERDKKYLERIRYTKGLLREFVDKYNVSNSDKQLLERTIRYLHIHNLSGEDLEVSENPLKLEIDCKY